MWRSLPSSAFAASASRRWTTRYTASSEAKDPWGNERVGFVAKTSIDRKDFGLTWNQVLEAGGILVGDRVDIDLDIQGVGAAAQSAA
jgi:polyisoprenoid-binding protein YceI